MPAPIVLRNLNPAPKRSAEQPIIATRSDMRDGKRGNISVAGAPTITSVLFNQDGSLTIQGTNFGAKEQAAPVLFDIATVAYENGIPNTRYGGLAHGAPLDSFQRTGDPTVIYDTVTSGATMNKEDSPRVPGGAFYRMPGEEGFVGYPMAYGGRNTPPMNEQLYFSWWFRRKWHWNYFRIAPDNPPTGTFIPGEDIEVVGTTAYGRFIDVEVFGGAEPNLYHFELSTYVTGTFTGETLRGLQSGAEIVFPTSFRGGNGYGFETAGTKYIRLRDDPSGGGLRGTLTPANWYMTSADGIYDRLGYTETPPEEWEFHEVWIDMNFITLTGRFHAWVNSRYRGVQELPSLNTPDPNLSLIFSLLGNDAHETFQVTDLSFVYLDKTPQRVYLGDAATWSEITHRELLRPTGWGDLGVTVADDLSIFDSNKWVYVVGPTGLVNETGFRSA